MIIYIPISTNTATIIQLPKNKAVPSALNLMKIMIDFHSLS